MKHEPETNLPDRILFGIDCGVHTGIALYNPANKVFILETLSFWQGIEYVRRTIKENPQTKFIIYIEDVTQNRPVFLLIRPYRN